MTSQAKQTSMKALYLSGLVFPGIGQFYLKTYTRGLLFSLVAAIGFYIFMEATWQLMQTIANDIDQGRRQLNISNLTLVLKQSLQAYHEPDVLMAKIAFGGSWLASMFDAYITTKKMYTVNNNA